ncbi:hypothetical protein GQ42DRAFT_170061 [Ramicandelaber brevisporus]|nr:hypothetical protein GQ42DRAFT_170061 [Ramicandelaber brevisporus]
MKLSTIALALATLVSVPVTLACSVHHHHQAVLKYSNFRSDSEIAYFEFKDDTDDKFVFKLTNPQLIKHARDILGGEANFTHITGYVAKSKVDYNPDWNFHLDADTIDYFNGDIPECDGSIKFVDEHLDLIGRGYLVDGLWCPSSSKLTREIKPDD